MKYHNPNIIKPNIKPEYLIVPGDGMGFAGASAVQAVLSRESISQLLLHPDPRRATTLSGRGAVLKANAANSLVVVTEIHKQGPKFAGPQSYLAAAAMLGVTQHGMYERKPVHLEVSGPGTITAGEVPRYDFRDLKFSALSGGDDAERILSMLGDL